MSLTYKTKTTRQCDQENWKTSEFYVAGYGALSVTDDRDHVKRAGAVHIRFSSERLTERMDVLWAPELDLHAGGARQYRPYLANLTQAALDELRHQLSGTRVAATTADTQPPRNYRLALTKKPGVKLYQEVRHVSNTGPRHCDEYLFRVVILKFLLESDLRDVYRVYAALSPLHERHVEEITALSNERALPGDEILTTERVAIILNWLRKYEFAAVPMHVPLSDDQTASIGSLTAVDYDHCLGMRVRRALCALFTLAPGTELSDKDYVEKRRTEMRRSVHAYRQERTVEILRATKEFISADINASRNAIFSQIVRARGLSARRVLLEHNIVSDVLHARRLGARDGEIAGAAATTARRGGEGECKLLNDDMAGPNAEIDPPLKPALPLKIRRIIDSCSCLPEPPLQASPRSDGDGDSDNEATNKVVPVVKPPLRRLCNTWENYTRYEFFD